MIRLVQATSATDFNQVQQLYYETWQATYRGMIADDYLNGLTPQTWHPEKRIGHTWLAYVGNNLVGVCSYGPARDSAFTGWQEVYSLYVRPHSQGLGVGRQLLQAALRSLDSGNVYLTVLTANVHAQRFYQRFGFELSAEQINTQVAGTVLCELRMERQVVTVPTNSNWVGQDGR